MLCEELVSRRLFVELEGSISQQVVPARSIVRGEQRIGGDADSPEETDAPKMFMNSLTLLTIIAYAL
jgi:hypothetical protein